MKQVTGSNRYPLYKDVSIQFTLGGHSFSAPVLSDEVLQSDEKVLFEIVTPRVTLVPREAFDNAIADKYLATVGLHCQSDEVCVCSEMQAPIIAVMAIKREVLQYVVDALGSRACFTSPLLDQSHDAMGGLYVQIAGSCCFVRYYKDSLRVAEAFEVTSTEELLYRIASLCDGIADGANTPIYINGDKQYAKTLKRYFVKVVCE